MATQVVRALFALVLLLSSRVHSQSSTLLMHSWTLLIVTAVAFHAVPVLARPSSDPVAGLLADLDKFFTDPDFVYRVDSQQLVDDLSDHFDSVWDCLDAPLSDAQNLFDHILASPNLSVRSKANLLYVLLLTHPEIHCFRQYTNKLARIPAKTQRQIFRKVARRDASLADLPKEAVLFRVLFRPLVEQYRFPQDPVQRMAKKVDRLHHLLRVPTLLGPLI